MERKIATEQEQSSQQQTCYHIRLTSSASSLQYKCYLFISHIQSLPAGQHRYTFSSLYVCSQGGASMCLFLAYTIRVNTALTVRLGHSTSSIWWLGSHWKWAVSVCKSAFAVLGNWWEKKYERLSLTRRVFVSLSYFDWWSLNLECWRRQMTSC